MDANDVLEAGFDSFVVFLTVLGGGVGGFCSWIGVSSVSARKKSRSWTGWGRARPLFTFFLDGMLQIDRC